MTAQPDSPVAPGWEALLSEAGTALLTEVCRTLDEPGVSATQLNGSLRKRGIDPALIAAVLTQAEMRRKARAKFGDLAGSLLFTQAGLEQATRAPVARLHAARFAAAGCHAVADLGCGIGAESLALLAAGVAPRAVELDPFTSQLAGHNLAALASSLGRDIPAVTNSDALSFDLAGCDGAFLDPARRTAGHRDTRRIASPDDYSPSLNFAFAVAESLPTGVKLGPGLDRELIPDRAEAQWVSVDGQVVETGLWFGPVARPGVKRAALVMRGDECYELTAAADSVDAETRGLGDYLYEPDGAVIRARLIGDLARSLGAGMLSEKIAYLTSDALAVTPFAQGFRVLDRLPAKEKELRRALAERDIGTLEIKKRGVDVDPAALRKRLKLRGKASATVFLTRDGDDGHIALLAERC
ncbi:THUMP-like domain-containing protein [Leucobacter sp. HY1910]